MIAGIDSLKNIYRSRQLKAAESCLLLFVLRNKWVYSHSFAIIVIYHYFFHKKSQEFVFRKNKTDRNAFIERLLKVN